MSFSFVQSLVKFDVPVPFQLTEKFRLERATQKQAQMIYTKLREIAQTLPFNTILGHYGHELEVISEGNAVRAKRTPLPEDKWLYWVVTFDGANTDEHELELALLLLNKEIHLGFQFVEVTPGSFGFYMNPTPIFTFFNDPERANEFPIVVTEQELAPIERYFTSIKIARDSSNSAHFALEMFNDVRSLPWSSRHKILAYFGIIESLLTHMPGDKEIGDSLTHQLKTKLPLLERFFPRELDFTAFGAKALNKNDKETIWKNLYKYRSFIAHGNRFEFEKSFASLKSPESVSEFLREVTKLVLVTALEQPEFLEDLKAV
jgi:hypothetical protein